MDNPNLSKDQLREILSEYQSLLKSPAWGRLVELAEEQIETRKNVLLAQEEQDLSDLLEGVRLKAEIRAFKLWLKMPDLMIDSLREELGYVADEVGDEG